MVIAVMLALTVVVALGAALAPVGTTAKSVILIGWMGIMIAVLRRYRL